jgi:hypothetical protein
MTIKGIKLLYFVMDTQCVFRQVNFFFIKYRCISGFKEFKGGCAQSYQWLTVQTIIYLISVKFVFWVNFSKILNFICVRCKKRLLAASCYGGLDSDAGEINIWHNPVPVEHPHRLIKNVSLNNTQVIIKWFTHLIWTVFSVVHSVFFIVLWHCTTLCYCFSSVYFTVHFSCIVLCLLVMYVMLP